MDLTLQDVPSESDSATTNLPLSQPPTLCNAFSQVNKEVNCKVLHSPALVVVALTLVVRGAISIVPVVETMRKVPAVPALLTTQTWLA
jgi:hypothetical protein